MTLFAFFSAVNIYSKLLLDLGYGNLGFHGVGLLYFVFSLTSFAAPSVVGMMKSQTALILGEISFTIWILSALIATQFQLSEGAVSFVVLFGSAINGIGGSLIWTAQGKYISDLV